MRRLRVQHLSRPVDWPTEDTDVRDTDQNPPRYLPMEEWPSEDTEEPQQEPEEGFREHLLYYGPTSALEYIVRMLNARWRAMNG